MPSPEVTAALNTLVAAVKTRKKAAKKLETANLNLDAAMDLRNQKKDAFRLAGEDFDAAETAVTVALNAYQSVLEDTP